MNKNSKLEYYTVAAFVSIGSLVIVLAINLTVAGFWERLGWVLLASLGTMSASAIVCKMYGRDAFSSKRAAGHSLLMIVIRAALFATGAVALISIFLSGGELTREMDGITWLNMQYAMTYAFTYGVIYILSYLLSAIVLVRV